ncbi:molybdate ABC transporter substrate-binding protein [Actinomadura viridis]|uniref:Molybdate transport system substrate-binding protein n=1 Tax=Actinomadura viridis TaxID=58110 RepID=A0A931GI37_9ACTN|nr:molybdate ABC transporter substrate-binding protein [Actinomadura viridis]MBG6087935.1 molybdate transport system substrate-binding protein [Actinomadura viridis]
MPDSPRWRRIVACAVLSLVGLGAVAAGCGETSGRTTLTVLAASSTQEVLRELGAAYGHERRHVAVRFESGGSQEMAERLSEHGPADVLLTADEATMNRADRYLTGRRRVVAHNSMTIAVGPGNPRRVRDLRDLTRPGLRVAVAAAANPAGTYARQIFAGAGLTVRWSSEEISVRAVLDRVRTGEADAGLVYITDLRSAGAAASSVPIPALENVTATYAAAVVEDSDDEEEAASFVAWLTSPTARALLTKYGFVTPS